MKPNCRRTIQPLVCFKMLFYLMIRKELFQIFASSDAVGEGKDVVGLTMSLEVRDICNKTSDVMWYSKEHCDNDLC